MNNNNNNNTSPKPTFTEWKKSNPSKTLNDYYKIYKDELTSDKTEKISFNTEVKSNIKSKGKLKWFIILGVIIAIFLTIILLPNSKFSLFINNTVGLSSNQIQGKFIRISNNDKENNLLGALKVKGLVKYIEFNGNHCTFDYVGISTSATFEIDGSKLYINTGGELGVLKMEIINENQLEGEGWIDGTFEKQ